jgi:adenylate cyclase
MPFLSRIHPDGTQIERWETGARPLVVGRGECADAFVEDDALSRSHFLIVGEGSDYFLIDLNSSNGTWVNGRRVSAQKLPESEFILAGESIFYFCERPITNFILPAALIALWNSGTVRAQAQVA